MRRRDKNVRQLRFPLGEADARALRAGERVELSGMLLTAREAGHRYLLEHDPPLLREVLRDGALYHCGPVVRKLKRKEDWKIVAAGPSESRSLDALVPGLLARFGIRALVGMGGMGEQTREACRRHGAVYCAAVGGAASLLAGSVVKVNGVSKLDFGIPEALWELEVRHFPAVVAMDSHGESLYERVARESAERYRDLLS
jgi:fumarate hydratase class I